MSLLIAPETTQLSYGENEQTSKLRFAILRQGYGQLIVASAIFKCRDFINEVITANTLMRPVGAYGFCISPGSTYMFNGMAGILVGHPDLGTFQHAVSTIINPKCEKYGLIPCSFGDVAFTNKDLAKFTENNRVELYSEHQWAVLTFDENWLNNHFTLSFFTNVLRLCSYGYNAQSKLSPEDNLTKLLEGGACTTKMSQFDVKATKHFVDNNWLDMITQQLRNIDKTKIFNPKCSVVYRGAESYKIGKLTSQSVHNNTGWFSVWEGNPATSPQQKELELMKQRYEQEEKAA